MINAIHNSYPQLQPAPRVSGGRSFAVPESPLRADDAKRADDNRNVADSVELSSTRPDLLGLPQQTIAPIPIEDRTPFGFSAASADLLDSEKRRAAGEDDAVGEAEEAEKDEEAEPGQATDAKGEPLDEEQQQQVSELKNRDREVRQHEQAHKAAGGSYAGAISYDYQQGPDGKRYAVGGEVSIDVSEEKDPSATAAKMRQVRAAALAPADPSGQDLKVAAEASRLETEARREIREETIAETQGENENENVGGKKGEGENATAAADSASNEQPAAVSRSSGGASFSRLSDPYTRAAAATRSFAMPAMFGHTGLDVMA